MPPPTSISDDWERLSDDSFSVISAADSDDPCDFESPDKMDKDPRSPPAKADVKRDQKQEEKKDDKKKEKSEKKEEKIEGTDEKPTEKSVIEAATLEAGNASNLPKPDQGARNAAKLPQSQWRLPLRPAKAAPALVETGQVANAVSYTGAWQKPSPAPCPALPPVPFHFFAKNPAKPKEQEDARLDPDSDPIYMLSVIESLEQKLASDFFDMNLSRLLSVDPQLGNHLETVLHRLQTHLGNLKCLVSGYAIFWNQGARDIPLDPSLPEWVTNVRSGVGEFRSDLARYSSSGFKNPSAHLLPTLEAMQLRRSCESLERANSKMDDFLPILQLLFTDYKKQKGSFHHEDMPPVPVKRDFYRNASGRVRREPHRNYGNPAPSAVAASSYSQPYPRDISDLLLPPKKQPTPSPWRPSPSHPHTVEEAQQLADLNAFPIHQEAYASLGSAVRRAVSVLRGCSRDLGDQIDEVLASFTRLVSLLHRARTTAKSYQAYDNDIERQPFNEFVMATTPGFLTAAEFKDVDIGTVRDMTDSLNDVLDRPILASQMSAGSCTSVIDSTNNGSGICAHGMDKAKLGELETLAEIIGATLSPSQQNNGPQRQQVLH